MPLYNPGGGGVTLDATGSDIAALGSQAAGSVGKAADAGHVHAMPTLDQPGAPAGNVSLNSHKITSLANGAAASDAAAFGQIPATLDAVGAPAGNVSLNSHKITSLSNGSAGTDAAAFGQILPAAGGVMTGNLELAAGTTGLAPLTLQSGTNLTTATAGDAEFDGTSLYFTSVAASRQVVSTEQVQVLSGGYTLANDTSAHPIFNASTNGAITLAASTTYEFEGLIYVTGLSSSSHTVSLGFGGTATFTSILYYSFYTPNAGGGTLSGFIINTAAATAAMVAGTQTVYGALLKGVMRINGAGTVIPQITQNTASAAGTVNTNSYFRCWPIGSNTVTNIGDWS
jgi:hypothetical protein